MESRRKTYMPASSANDNLVFDGADHKSSHKFGGSLTFTIFLGLLCLVSTFAYFHEHSTRMELETQVDQLIRLNTQYSTLISETQNKLSDAQAQFTNHLNASPDPPSTGTIVTNSAGISKLEAEVATHLKRIKKDQKSKDKLVLELQKVSKELVLAKFGPPPYIVEMKLNVPGDAQDNRIRIEMAPLHLVPYTILYFLSQVTSNAWDGCSFIRNAGHVLQASTRGKQCAPKAFRQLTAVSESVAFQEYSDQFPHIKHTVGLAGRPGGPDFYVSIMDNTYNHGPGGQTQYDAQSEADACFGYLVPNTGGEEVLKRIHKLPIHSQDHGYKLLADFVTIESASLVLSDSQ